MRCRKETNRQPPLGIYCLASFVIFNPHPPSVIRLGNEPDGVTKAIIKSFPYPPFLLSPLGLCLYVLTPDPA